MGSDMPKKHSAADKVVPIAGGAKILGALGFHGLRVSTTLRQRLSSDNHANQTSETPDTLR